MAEDLPDTEQSPIIIKCKDVMVPVPINILCQESTEFKKQFACYLATNKEATDDPSEEKQEQKTVDDIISLKDSVLTTQVIELEEYDSLAVKILFDYIKGCPLLMQSSSLQSLDDMIQMCRKFGIAKPLSAIADRLKSVGIITAGNLAQALEVAQNLQEQEGNDDFKELADHLIKRIFTLAKYSLTSQEAITTFVLGNKTRKKQVLELLRSLEDKSGLMFARWSATQWNAVINSNDELIDECNRFILNNCVFTFVLDMNSGYGGVAVKLLDPSNPENVKELEKDLRIDLKLYFVNGNRRMLEWLNHTFKHGELFDVSLQRFKECELLEVEALVNMERLFEEEPKFKKMKESEKETDICWFAKEAHDLDKYTNSWNRHEDSPDVPATDSSLLLKCGGCYVYADKKALMKEAMYFDSKFGKFWDKKNSDDVTMTDDRGGKKTEMGRQHFSCYPIPDHFDPAALNILIDDLNHPSYNKLNTFLNTSGYEDIGMVVKILAICEFFGINRPIKDVIKKFRVAPLFVGMRLVKQLEDLPSYKGLVENIQYNCNHIASSYFQTTDSLINFIVENEDNFDCMVDLFTELGTKSTTSSSSDKKRLIFRFTWRGGAHATVHPYAGNMNWVCRMYMNDDDRMFGKLECLSLGSREEITVECHIEVFRPDDSWSSHTVFKTESPVKVTRQSLTMTMVAQKSPDELTRGFMKDGTLYYQLTINIVEYTGRSDIFRVTEDQILLTKDKDKSAGTF